MGHLTDEIGIAHNCIRANVFGLFFKLMQFDIFWFNRFQMKVHHPCGRHGEDSGGWAANDTLWKVNTVSWRLSGIDLFLFL